jgi:hypothetical protein
MKEEDPFDLDKLRASPEIVEAQRQKVAERRAIRPPKSTVFIKVPQQWVKCLAKAHHIATYRVLLHLLDMEFQQWAKGQPIPVSTAAMKELGVCRSDKEKALRELEAFGICTVERHPRRCPRAKLTSLKPRS